MIAQSTLVWQPNFSQIGKAGNEKSRLSRQKQTKMCVSYQRLAMSNCCLVDSKFTYIVYAYLALFGLNP